MTRIELTLSGLACWLFAGIGAAVLSSVGGLRNDPISVTCMEYADTMGGTTQSSADEAIADWSITPFGLRCSIPTPTGSFEFRSPSWALAVGMLFVVLIAVAGLVFVVGALVRTTTAGRSRRPA